MPLRVACIRMASKRVCDQTVRLKQPRIESDTRDIEGSLADAMQYFHSPDTSIHLHVANISK